MVIPKVLNQRYELQARLSQKNDRGSYRAIDLQTGRTVMVKLLVFSAGTSWESIRLFEREVEVLKSLDYDTIPQYLDTFEYDFEDFKGFGLVQEFIDCRSLEEHLEKGRVFSEKDIIEIANSLLETLDYLHHQIPPVIHRDIKPSNILLSDRSAHSVGEVFLVDFGAGKRFAEQSSLKADLYDLGATLLCLITGKLPSELINNDLEMFLYKSRGISVDFKNWLGKLLKNSHSNYPNSAREAAYYLKNRHLIHSSQDISAMNIDSPFYICSSNLTFELSLKDRFRSRSLEFYLLAMVFILIAIFIASLVLSFIPGQYVLVHVLVFMLIPLMGICGLLLIPLFLTGIAKRLKKTGEIYNLVIHKTLLEITRTH